MTHHDMLANTTAPGTIFLAVTASRADNIRQSCDCSWQLQLLDGCILNPILPMLSHLVWLEITMRDAGRDTDGELIICVRSSHLSLNHSLGFKGTGTTFIAEQPIA